MFLISAAVVKLPNLSSLDISNLSFSIYCITITLPFSNVIFTKWKTYGCWSSEAGQLISKTSPVRRQFSLGSTNGAILKTSPNPTNLCLKHGIPFPTNIYYIYYFRPRADFMCVIFRPRSWWLRWKKRRGWQHADVFILLFFIYFKVLLNILLNVLWILGRSQICLDYSLFNLF